MTRSSFILCCVLLFTLQAQCMNNAHEVRTWTSSSGSQVQASLLSFDHRFVTLVSSDGRQFQIRIAKLSEDDRRFLERSSTVARDGEAATPDTENSGPPAWFTSFDEAKAQAKKENKKLFILFTDSEFCAPCRKLKANVLASDAFLEYAREKLILFKADKAMEREDPEGRLTAQNAGLMKEYPHQGVPWIFIARKSGSIIGQTSGYLGESPDQFIAERLKQYVK